MATETKRPVVQLIAEVINEVTALLQTELRLVRVEMNEKFSRLASGGVMMGVAAALMIAGLEIGFLAIVEWLIVAGLTSEWALTLVAVVALAAGGLFAARGIASIKKADLVPERSLQHVREDIHTIKEHAL
jgi:uncharacterized membrane protein YqjE